MNKKDGITYFIPENSELYKRGLIYIFVLDGIESEDKINDFFGTKERIKRRIQTMLMEKDIKVRIINGVDISLEALENPDSKNTIWLKEYGFYDLFIEAKELLDSLSELLIGNYITTSQVESLMEKGYLYRIANKRNSDLLETFQPHNAKLRRQIEDKKNEITELYEEMKQEAEQIAKLGLEKNDIEEHLLDR